MYLDACSSLGVPGHLRAISRHMHIVLEAGALSTRGLCVSCCVVLAKLLPLETVRSKNYLGGSYTFMHSKIPRPGLKPGDDRRIEDSRRWHSCWKMAPMELTKIRQLL